MEELKLKLIRVRLKEDYTEGVLINENSNQLLFDILEDKVRDINGDGDLLDEGEGKIYGITAIPYGEYECEVTWSPKFERYMVLVKNVKHFTGIRMHYAKNAGYLEGCIGGGEKTKDGELKNTGFTDYMVNLLNQYGGKAKLKII